MDQPASKTRASRAFGSADKPWRVLGKLKTPSLEVEEAEYPPGLCMPRHFHKTSNFVYIIAGAHWVGDGDSEAFPMAHEGTARRGVQVFLAQLLPDRTERFENRNP
jgi:quercetin dioxygenase-like cupin family protein